MSKSSVTVVVDRIEGSIAVIEVAGTTVDWPVSALPVGVSEGSTLVISVKPPSSTETASSDSPRHIDL